MRYNAKSLEVKVVISGKVLHFKHIKISLGILITAREMHALFRENPYLEVLTTANNLITVSAVQARREGGCDGCARTPPQTAEVHFFVKKINKKIKKKISVVLFVLF